MARRLCPTCEREAVKLCLLTFVYGMLLGASVVYVVLDKATP